MKEIIKKLMKSRPAKVSERGIYIKDGILGDTEFKIGTPIQYFLDFKQKKLLIIPSEQGGNRVARRTNKDGVQGVIDIRVKEITEMFKSCDAMQISIYDDEIIIEGIDQSEQEDVKEGLVSKVINHSKNLFKSKKSTAAVVEINEILKSRKKNRIVLSKSQFKKVVGGEQLSFDMFQEWDIVGTSSTDTKGSIRSIREAMDNLYIPLTLGSVFSGAGMLDYAFKEEGFENVYALEVNESAAETYNYNLGNHCMVDDIRTIDKSKMPKPSVIIGGVPCPAFAKVNRKKRLTDHDDFFLFKEFIEVIKQNENCKLWMIENTEEFVTCLDGYIVEELERLLPDFEISFGILNSADYGAPMIRKRAVVIGAAKEIGRVELPEPMYSKSEYRTVAEALEGITEDLPNQQDVNKHKPDTLERIKHIPPGGNHKNLPEDLRKGMKAQFSDYMKRIRWDAPSISMVHPRKSLILHPEENRVVSVREIARIFGLPDSFVFKGKTLDARQQQVINGTSVQMFRVIAEKIKNAIVQANIRNRSRKPVARMA